MLEPSFRLNFTLSTPKVKNSNLITWPLSYQPQSLAEIPAAQTGLLLGFEEWFIHHKFVLWSVGDTNTITYSAFTKKVFSCYHYPMNFDLHPIYKPQVFLPDPENKKGFLLCVCITHLYVCATHTCEYVCAPERWPSLLDCTRWKHCFLTCRLAGLCCQGTVTAVPVWRLSLCPSWRKEPHQAPSPTRKKYLFYLKG